MVRARSKTLSAEDQVLRRRIRVAVLISTCISGAAALIYEVAWTRELSLVFGSTVYAVSMMLAAFMAGLSLGGFIGGRWADKEGARIIRALALIEMGIGLFGVLSIPLIRFLPGMYYWMHRSLSTPGWTFFMIQLLLSFLVMLVPTTLMGATFPIVSKVNARSYSQMGRAVGDAYSVNTLGSIAGSLAAGFLLIPLIGVKGAIVTAGVLNMVVSVGLLFVAQYSGWRRHAVTVAVLFGVVMLGGALTPDSAFTLGFPTMSRYPTYADYELSRDQTQVLFSADNASGRVAVTEKQGVKTLRNSGFIEGSDDPADQGTTSLLAALPYAYARNPESALVIGLGTGYTSYTMLSLPLKTVDSVEINPAVVTASKYFVDDQLETNPRWKLHIDDARQYLNTTDRKYDIISSEPSWPLTESVAHLFTHEFFKLANSSLNDGGVIVQWLPGYLINEEDLAMVYKTFSNTFPVSAVWSAQPNGMATDLFLIGVKGDTPLQTDEAVIASVEERLAAVGLQGVSLSRYALSVGFERAAGDPSVPMNTDDRPLLEFRVINNLVKTLENSVGAN